MSNRLILAGLALIIVGSYINADNYLDPPGLPGSPEARMRTMNEVLPALPISSLPFAITNSGAYVVVGNLTGVSGSNGISICVDNVTLDLNGFSIRGVNGSLRGIDISNSQNSVTIRNGVIRDWGEYGLYAFATDNSVFSGLTSISNGWNANGIGILVGKNNLVSDCVSANNKYFGISADTGCTIRDCKAYGNGSRGIGANDGSTITGCSAYNNNGEGITTYNGSTISKCMAYQNLLYGIYGQNCTIRDCAVYGNTQSGIYAEMCTVSGISASKNKSHGIFANMSVITRCIAYQNTEDGIRACYSLVEGNSCQSNGDSGDGAGIRTIGDKNRVENNLSRDNDRGIEASESGNFIVKNTCGGNGTNYAITGQQVIGPIESQSGTITNQNPWTNFEF